MKKGMGIGTLILIGLVIWWLTKKPAEALAETPALVSEDERLIEEAITGKTYETPLGRIGF